MAMTITLAIRKRWVRPEGTKRQGCQSYCREAHCTRVPLEPRTVTVVMEVKKLVVPLCYYSESVFDKGHDDEEAANGGKEAIQDRG